MTDSIDHDRARQTARYIGTDGVAGVAFVPVENLARAYLDMRARNERMREALEPFGRMADVFDGARYPTPNQDDDTFYARETAKGCRQITVGDLRRARSAYEEGRR